MIRKAPWLDHAGKFAAFKALVFVLLFVPFTLTAIDYAQGNLGPRPNTEAIHAVGLCAIRYLFIALAVTPFRQLLKWPRLADVRRMIGVASFAYIAVHLSLYTADQMFDLEKVATEIALRIYLTIGFVALLGLASLAATSTDGMVRRLGAKSWRRLHRIVYGIGLLAVIHFFMQSKLDVWEPTIMAGFYLWLMGWRALPWIGVEPRRAGALAALGLTVAAWVVTMLGEALYFELLTPAPFARVLEANLMLELDMLRPGWIVLAGGLALTVAAALRAVLARGTKKLRPEPA